MHTLVVGLSHQTAPVELREKFSFDPDRIAIALRALRDMKSMLECVIVSTCNRTELYIVADQLHTGEYYAKTFLESWFRVSREEFVPHLYVKTNTEAVRHLFRVVCGLESLVIGETQILGQVKQAFQSALQAGTTGTLFNHLFKQAISLGKKAHTQTEIGQNAVSVSYAAVELGKKLFTSFAKKTILLVGAGKMSELTAKHFRASGVKNVIVVNRTFTKAQELAAVFQGTAYPWEDLSRVLEEADVVVSSTGAKQFVITREMVQATLVNRKKPLFFIDIAVPRDIDPDVNQLDNAFLYNMDDLEEIVAANVGLREQEAIRVEVWIKEEQASFQEWLDTLGVVPVIRALRSKSLQIQTDTMTKIERKLPDLTEQQRRVINKQTKSIVNQMMHDPIMRMKELASTEEKEAALRLFQHLFALEVDDEPKDQEAKSVMPNGLPLPMN
ncbi:glutamyl-tRNA reductase [Shimazuella sp. AN120528]|uniref:glutamyl-tRNA reductase n=1 Tax=Shimazuella soli TaxID=1892854 RepID=UPI001F0F512E|nr:glutamyl-tRNA reductase [Shimazuella soli]MCH5584664.1 glutamyl-tRNA reductase [Shimazuella soli]